MKVKRTFVAIVGLFLAAAVWATPLKVTWVEGKVEKQKGTTWIAINIGDTVDTADVIRLAKAAMAEFSDGRRKIVLSAAGTFSLDAVAKAGAAQAGKSSGTLDRLAKIVDPKAGTGQTAVGGVRGDLIGAGVDQMSWEGEEDDSAALITQAQDLVHEAKYAEAAGIFGQAAGVAEGDKKTQALYGQAWSLASAGSTLQAIKILRSMPSTGIWAAPRALLLARLDLQTGALDEAKALLDEVIASGVLAGEDLDMAKAMQQEAGATK